MSTQPVNVDKCAHLHWSVLLLLGLCNDSFVVAGSPAGWYPIKSDVVYACGRVSVRHGLLRLAAQW